MYQRNKVRMKGPNLNSTQLQKYLQVIMKNWEYSKKDQKQQNGASFSIIAPSIEESAQHTSTHTQTARMTMVMAPNTILSPREWLALFRTAAQAQHAQQ